MNPAAWMLLAIGIFVLGFLFGMAMQRVAFKNAAQIEDLTDWEGDQ